MVELSGDNASVVKFDGSLLPPSMLPSSTDDVYCLSCAPTEHIILYL